MKTNGAILVLVEPELHPQTVIARAAWLAGKTGCDLHLWYCDPDVNALSHGIFMSNETRDLATQLRNAQQEVIDELASDARGRGFRVFTEILEERPPADALLRIAAELKPRYVLKGTEYHSIAQRSIFLDTDWQLIRTCPYPLWLVKPHDFREDPVVVAAVDPVHSHDKPAALDQLIVDAAKEVCAGNQGDLHLFHTYERIAGIGKEATRTFKPIKLPVESLSERIQAEHRALLDNLAAANGIDDAHTHQLPGSATELLPTFTRARKTDLVVMGALARWGLRRMIIGSTAERVLDHLPCDILIVRQPDESLRQAIAV